MTNISEMLEKGTTEFPPPEDDTELTPRTHLMSLAPVRRRRLMRGER